jgi:glutamine amidotransferase
VANIARALDAAGAALELTREPDRIAAAPRLVLPGVGSFAAAMRWLETTGVGDAVRSAVGRGAHLLGICVGHQVLFESSEEMGHTRGLAILHGEVRRLAGSLPVPQIGWNRVRWNGGGESLFAGVPPDTPFYFVNSYAVCGAEDEIAFAEYGQAFTAAAAGGRVSGVQFHPEKSSAAGIRVLRNFLTCD